MRVIFARALHGNVSPTMSLQSHFKERGTLSYLDFLPKNMIGNLPNVSALHFCEFNLIDLDQL